jgi:hypothetical protein
MSKMTPDERLTIVLGLTTVTPRFNEAFVVPTFLPIPIGM